MLIPLISPRKLILVAGTKEETDALAADCKSLLLVKESESDSNSAFDVYTPVLNQTVDASVDTNAWIVKLSRNLAKRLQWQSVRTMNIVTLTAQLRGEAPTVDDAPPNSAHKKQKLLKGDSEIKHESSVAPESQDGVVPVLDTLPTNIAAVSRSNAQPLHVGDMRLADLRRLMLGTGHSAEFRGEGTLVIDSNIAVKKLGTGRIVVESAAANAIGASNRGRSNLQDVKKQIYAGLAVVAGG
jgi:cleavage and polyadenylation specificity factor subunit 2